MPRVNLYIVNLSKTLPARKEDDTHIPHHRSARRVLENIAEALNQPRAGHKGQGLKVVEPLVALQGYLTKDPLSCTYISVISSPTALYDVAQPFEPQADESPNGFIIHGKTPLERVLKIMAQLRAVIKNPNHEHLTEELVKLFNKLAEHHQLSADHSARVAEEAFYIALDLKLEPRKLFKLINSAFLHDLGKIGVPVATLDYPGRLSDSQWAEIKAHPEIGYKMLRGGEHFPDDLVGYNGVLEHHVWIKDKLKKGYPDLRGKEPSFIARIIEVADVYDALTDPNRAYRKPASIEEALKMIIRGIGTQFDEIPVQSLIKIKGCDFNQLQREIKSDEEELKALVLGMGTIFSEVDVKKALGEKGYSLPEIQEKIRSDEKLNLLVSV